MKIDIQTKFNIGDRVWIPELYEWYITKKEGAIICGINIYVDSNKERILYLIKEDGGFIYECRETLCFGNYEDCKQWCDENNTK